MLTRCKNARGDFCDLDSVQGETINVEMQKYSDVINELKSSQELCAQLETRCAEQSTELEYTKATMEENQQAFDVRLTFLFEDYHVGLFVFRSQCVNDTFKLLAICLLDSSKNMHTKVKLNKKNYNNKITGK